jgi:hypothetical protein
MGSMEKISATLMKKNPDENYRTTRKSYDSRSTIQTRKIDSNHHKNHSTPSAKGKRVGVDGDAFRHMITDLSDEINIEPMQRNIRTRLSGQDPRPGDGHEHDDRP